MRGMGYKPKGMHLAAHPELKTCVCKSKPWTPRSILKEMGVIKGTKMRWFLNSWDWGGKVGPVVMPTPREEPCTLKVSRTKKVSYLTKIAQKLPAKLPAIVPRYAP